MKDLEVEIEKEEDIPSEELEAKITSLSYRSVLGPRLRKSFFVDPEESAKKLPGHYLIRSTEEYVLFGYIKSVCLHRSDIDLGEVKLRTLPRNAETNGHLRQVMEIGAGKDGGYGISLVQVVFHDNRYQVTAPGEELCSVLELKSDRRLCDPGLCIMPAATYPQVEVHQLTNTKVYSVENPKLIPFPVVRGSEPEVLVDLIMPPKEYT